MLYSELLNRHQTARYITARWGFPCSPATLATWATRGGGPLMVKNGVHVLYNKFDIDTWALERMSPQRRSTSDTVHPTRTLPRPPTEEDMGDLPDTPRRPHWMKTGQREFDEITHLIEEQIDIEARLVRF